MLSQLLDNMELDPLLCRVNRKPEDHPEFLIPVDPCVGGCQQRGVKWWETPEMEPLRYHALILAVTTALVNGPASEGRTQPGRMWSDYRGPFGGSNAIAGACDEEPSHRGAGRPPNVAEEEHDSAHGTELAELAKREP